MPAEKRIAEISKKYRQSAALILLAAAFAVGAASFNYLTQSGDFVKWASPDETANYIFAKLYAGESRLTIAEKYNLYADDIMRPRSFRSDRGEMKPVSFPGIILIYGKIAAVAGAKVIPYLTPVFAGLGLVFYYLLVKKIFGRRNALISVFLLASLPPYIYYSARSMFHNVLFFVLLTGGLYCALIMSGADGRRKFALGLKSGEFGWRGFLLAAAGGVLTGLAVITRASELLWILPLFVIIWIFNIRRADSVKIAVFASFAFLAVLPALYHNQILYGSYYFGGYGEMNRSLVTIAGAGKDLVTTTARGEFSFYGDLFGIIKKNIFYFGFHPRQSAEMFYRYFIGMFPWIFWPALGGLVILLRRGRRLGKKRLAFLSAALTVSLILVLYYGSWKFNDNPDANAHTIGNSYTRYWLPVYAGAIPLAAYFFMKLTRVITDFLWRTKARFGFDRKYLRNVLRAMIVFAVFCLSVPFVLGGSDEGLLPLGRRLSASRAEAERILALTENNAAVITLYHDKLLFPERKVIVGLFDDTAMVARYARIAERLPVYYYNFTLPKKDIAYLNNRRLAEAGLAIEEVERITGDFTLYKLYKK